MVVSTLKRKRGLSRRPMNGNTTKGAKKLRKKKCRNPNCGERYRPWSTLQEACSPGCAIVVARLKEEKKRQREAREEKKRSKTLGELAREAQFAFNAYIRERDKHRPCISCGDHLAGRWNAGHYRTVGACPELRFDETNCHKQCAQCNQHKSGDIVNYRANLEHRIGESALAKLEGPHEPKNYTRDDFIEIRRIYKRKLKEQQHGSSQQSNTGGESR